MDQFNICICLVVNNRKIYKVENINYSMVNVTYVEMKQSDFDKRLFWSDFNGYMGAAITPDGIQKVLGFGVFDDPELNSMYQKLKKGFVGRLRACFPRDAFDYLSGMSVVMQERASNLPPLEKRIGLEGVVSDLEPEGFVDKVMNIGNDEVIDVEECRVYFRRYGWNRETGESGHPNETAVLSKMLKFIDQSLLLSCQKKDSRYKSQAVEMAKVVTYLVKAKESTHYYCSDEFKAVKRFSADRLL